jgi:hypothetical protein
MTPVDRDRTTKLSYELMMKSSVSLQECYAVASNFTVQQCKYTARTAAPLRGAREFWPNQGNYYSVFWTAEKNHEKIESG